MSGTFTFNGVSSATYGLLVNNVTNFGSPARVVEKVQVPYRNGDLLIDTGTYNNYIVTYQVALINNFTADARSLAAWLLAPQGYQNLTDSYNTGETRKAAYYNELDYTIEHLNRYGKATISFDCKPQRFLDSGETLIEIDTAGDVTVSNPTVFTAKPEIWIKGSAGDTCHIGQYDITLASSFTQPPATNGVYVDCENMQCYVVKPMLGGTNLIINMNAYVQMPSGFPVLGSGNTTVNKDTMTKVDIKPRWWRL